MALVVILISAMPINLRVKATTPKTIRVPTDYPTIQSAINAADNGDSILVASGVYYEQLTVKKSISLIGENRQTTIIDGNHSSRYVIQVSASNTTISGFTVRNGDGCGIELTSNRNVNVTDNILMQNHYGISLYYSCDNTIINNTINNNSWTSGGNGVDLIHSDGNIIEKNEIQRTEDCISLMGSCNNTIRSNYIASRTRMNPDSHIGGMGVNLYRMLLERASTDNKILNNNITDNTECVSMAFASNNIISGNIMENSETGIAPVYSSNNDIYLNNFLNNSRHVYNDYGRYSDPGYGIHLSVNRWDNGIVGNYWSDYEGTDSNGDDIGDTPYVINRNNIDNYPLMNQVFVRAALKLNILDDSKWYTAPNVPFNTIDEVQSFIEDFDEENPTPLEYGSVPMNLEIHNIGNEQTENIVINATISGFLGLINLSEESVAKDKEKFCNFPDYWEALSVGKIDKGQTKDVQINIPIKYLCLVAGQLLIDKGDEWTDNYAIDVIFAINLLNIKLQVNSSNCQVNYDTKIFVTGNPKQLTDLTLNALKDRLEYNKKQAWLKLLEMHIGLLASHAKSIVISVKDYTFDTSIPIEQGTSSVTIATILGGGTLISLVATLNDMQGVISTLQLTSSTVSGLAMVTFTGIEKLIPKGQLTLEISLRTQPQTASSRIAQVSQQNSNVTLIVTSKFEPRYFNVTLGNKDYQIAVASNATDINVNMDEHDVIRLNVTGIQNSIHFLKVTIPNEIMTDDFRVWVDNNEIHNLNMTQGTTYSTLYFTYSSLGSSEIEIIPEFPAPMFLLLFFVLPLLALLATKKRKKQDQSH